MLANNSLRLPSVSLTHIANYRILFNNKQHVIHGRERENRGDIHTFLKKESISGLRSKQTAVFARPGDNEIDIQTNA